MSDLYIAEGFTPELFLAPGLPRIRPILVMLCANAVRGDAVLASDEVEHAALATELLHAALIVHDAALGRQGGRRRRVARKILGAFGFLGGNKLTLRALELARQIPSPLVINDLLQALRDVLDAQHAASSWGEGIPSARESMDYAEQSSGAVYSFACRTGARLAGAERTLISGLGRYGFHLGVASSIAEDWKVLSQPEDKAIIALQDFAASGRPPYPLPLLADGNPELKALWISLRRDNNPETAARLLEQLKKNQGLSRSRDRILQASWSARSALRQVPPSKHRDDLDEIARSLV